MLPRTLPTKRLPSATVSSVKNTALPSWSKSSAALMRAGRNRAKTSMVREPTAATTKPTGVISKMENAGRSWARATPSTRRFVDVPIKVQVPPRMAA